LIELRALDRIQFGPVFICDHCHGEIDREDGSYIYRERDNGAAFYFVHKGECDRALQAAVGRLPRAMSLGDFLRYLGLNYRFNAEKSGGPRG
jgi:hypothetical protein